MINEDVCRDCNSKMTKQLCIQPLWQTNLTLTHLSSSRKIFIKAVGQEGWFFFGVSIPYCHLVVSNKTFYFWKGIGGWRNIHWRKFTHEQQAQEVTYSSFCHHQNLYAMTNQVMNEGLSTLEYKLNKKKIQRE